MAKSNIEKVWEILDLSHDDYMMLYWDFPNEKVMAIDHIGKETPVGEIHDVVTKGNNVVSFKIRKLMVKQLVKEVG